MEFSGEAVKVFFFVLVKVGENGLIELSDIFDCQKIIDSKVSAGFSWAIGCDSVVKDMGKFNGRGEGSVNQGVKMSVKGLEDRDRMFVCNTRFVNECSACDFKRSRKDTSGEDKGNKRVKSVCPSGVKTGKDVESEVVVSGFRWNMSNGIAEGKNGQMEDGGLCRRIGRGGQGGGEGRGWRWCRDEKEGPSGVSSISRGTICVA